MTDLRKFKAVHDIFNDYNVTHTIAVICNKVGKNGDLIDYINAHNNFDIQIHCWDHIPMTENENLTDDLVNCVYKIESVFGKKPTTVYPPWNLSNQKVIDIANGLGLIVSAEKISLSAYIRTLGHVKERVVNFHYWAEQESILIEPALKIYTAKEEKNKCL